jgi:hypothetical protein
MMLLSAIPFGIEVIYADATSAPLRDSIKLKMKRRFQTGQRAEGAHRGIQLRFLLLSI